MLAHSWPFHRSISATSAYQLFRDLLFYIYCNSFKYLSCPLFFLLGNLYFLADLSWLFHLLALTVATFVTLFCSASFQLIKVFGSLSVTQLYPRHEYPSFSFSILSLHVIVPASPPVPPQIIIYTFTSRFTHFHLFPHLTLLTARPLHHHLPLTCFHHIFFPALLSTWSNYPRTFTHLSYL